VLRQTAPRRSERDRSLEAALAGEDGLERSLLVRGERTPRAGSRDEKISLTERTSLCLDHQLAALRQREDGGQRVLEARASVGHQCAGECWRKGIGQGGINSCRAELARRRIVALAHTED
jgi:hypothetical protein